MIANLSEIHGIHEIIKLISSLSMLCQASQWRNNKTPNGWRKK